VFSRLDFKSSFLGLFRDDLETTEFPCFLVANGRFSTEKEPFSVEVFFLKGLTGFDEAGSWGHS